MILGSFNKVFGTKICEEAKGHKAALYGGAICEISYWTYEKTKTRGWWAYNGEYATLIFYCPFCGEKLPDLEIMNETSL